MGGAYGNQVVDRADHKPVRSGSGSGETPRPHLTPVQGPSPSHAGVDLRADGHPAGLLVRTRLRAVDPSGDGTADATNPPQGLVSPRFWRRTNRAPFPPCSRSSVASFTACPGSCWAPLRRPRRCRSVTSASAPSSGTSSTGVPITPIGAGIAATLSSTLSRAMSGELIAVPMV